MTEVTSPTWRLVMVMVAASAGASSLLGTDLGAEAVWEAVHRTSRLQEKSVGEAKSQRSSSRSVEQQPLRAKRQLIDFPDDAIMEFNFRLVVPYWTYPRVKTRGDYRLEVTYELPNQLLRRRKRRSLLTERSAFYNLLSDFLSKAGLEGEECVVRAVCEVGESPLDEYGILGEFINLIFAAGYGGREDHLQQAEEYGRTYGNCWSAFPHCPLSLREMLHEFFLNNGQVPTKTGA